MCRMRMIDWLFGVGFLMGKNWKLWVYLWLLIRWEYGILLFVNGDGEESELKRMWKVSVVRL